MQKRWIAVFTVWAGLLAGATEAQERYILSTTDAALTGVAERHGLSVVDVVRGGVDQVVLVDLPANRSSAEVEAEVADDSEVAGFERDRRIDVSERSVSSNLTQSTAAILEAFGASYPVGYFGATVPSSYVAQRAWSILQLGQAQAQATGNSIVAVIDTGVDATHPALRGVVIPGYDFTRNAPGMASDLADLSQSTAAILEQSTAAILEQSTAAILEQNGVILLNQSTAAILEQSTAAILEGLPPAFGHGTMVAGLIHYVAPTARIMPLKAFRADGSSQLSDIVRAVYYAADNGARVINMSFSTPESSHSLFYAIKYANKRAITVAAAGNEGLLTKMFPAAFSGVIGVGASTITDRRSSFSNYGTSGAKFAVPGEVLVTSYPGAHWAAVSGTSFSTALMSGALAMMVQVDPLLMGGDASSELRTKAIQIPGFSEGRINLPAVLAETLRRRR